MRISENAVEELSVGEWYEYEDEQGEKCSFLIAALNNENYKKKKSKLKEPYRRKIKKGTYTEEKDSELTIRATAGTVLLDWKGIAIGDDKTTPFSEEAGVLVLNARSDIAAFILLKASNLSEGKRREVTDAGNSSKNSSTGKSSIATP